MTHAAVVFLGANLVDGAAWWSRFLKHGFIHCFVVIQDQMGWIKVEVRYGSLVITHVDSHVLQRYAEQGATVLLSPVKPFPVLSPTIIRTCVGLVKAVLGIKSFSLTPWQLYKHLRKFT